MLVSRRVPAQEAQGQFLRSDERAKTVQEDPAFGTGIASRTGGEVVLRQ